MSAEGKWTPGLEEARQRVSILRRSVERGFQLSPLHRHLVDYDDALTASDALVADMAEALREICKGSIDVSHTAIIIGADALAVLVRARAALAKGGA